MRCWLLGTSVLALGMVSPAIAQQSVAEPAAATTGEGLDEIVVTAQRREQKLVDVPASVVAISGDTLVRSGVAAVDDLGRQAPGVIINRTGAYLQPTIRGVGMWIGVQKGSC